MALGTAGSGPFAPCPGPLVPGLVPGAASSLPRCRYPFPVCTTGRLPCSFSANHLNHWGCSGGSQGCPSSSSGLGRAVRALSPGAARGGDGEAGQGVSSWHGCWSRGTS